LFCEKHRSHLDVGFEPNRRQCYIGKTLDNTVQFWDIPNSKRAAFWKAIWIGGRAEFPTKSASGLFCDDVLDDTIRI